MGPWASVLTTCYDYTFPPTAALSLTAMPGPGDHPYFSPPGTIAPRAGRRSTATEISPRNDISQSRVFVTDAKFLI